MNKEKSVLSLGYCKGTYVIYCLLHFFKEVFEFYVSKQIFKFQSLNIVSLIPLALRVIQLFQSTFIPCRAT